MMRRWFRSRRTRRPVDAGAVQHREFLRAHIEAWREQNNRPLSVEVTP